jgi:Acetylornithine deacetylase/Succinyl-diaminopimelate desuccinylase and related deacylases
MYTQASAPALPTGDGCASNVVASTDAHEGKTMSASTESEITEWIASQKQAMIDLLRDAVNIDSGSYDKPGVDAVGARFERHFAEHGIEAWRELHDVFGDALHALVAKPGSNEKPVLLMGHRDTVFPKGEVARRPFTIEGPRLWAGGRRHESWSRHQRLCCRGL